MKSKITFGIVFLTLSFSPLFAGGSEFYPVFGGRTLALNGLYFAGYDGISNVLNNPAGLVNLNSFGFQFSLIDRVGQQEFVNPFKGLHRSYTNDDIGIGGGIYWNSGNLTIAAAYVPVIQYLVDWPYTMLRRKESATTVLGFDFSNSIKVNSVSPAAAYRLGNFALGISANIYLINYKTAFPQGNDEWFNDIGEAAYQINYELDGIGYGATIGMNGMISDNIKIGASIRTPVSSDIDGDASSSMFADLDSAAVNSGVSTTFEIPWIVGAGLIYTVNQNFNINLDFSYSLWGGTQEVWDFSFDNETWNSRLSEIDTVTGIKGTSFQLNFENTFAAGIGLEYFTGSGLAIRAGYRFNQNPNTTETYNMLFPSVSSHNFSFGLGFFGSNYTIDASVLYSAGVQKEIQNEQYGILRGNYDASTFIPTVTLIYKL